MLGKDFICSPFATVLVSKIVFKCDRNTKKDSGASKCCLCPNLPHYYQPKLLEIGRRQECIGFQRLLLGSNYEYRYQVYFMYLS